MDDIATPFHRGLLVAPDCAGCPLRGSRIVPPEGNPRAKIALVGEAPGMNEEQTGQPFSGPSGNMLNLLLKRAEINRSDLWITNAASCRTRTVEIDGEPTAPEKVVRIAAMHCRSRLLGELAIVQPSVIVPLGGVAFRAVHGGEYSMDKRRGGIHTVDVVSELARVRDEGQPHARVAKKKLKPAPEPETEADDQDDVEVPVGPGGEQP